MGWVEREYALGAWLESLPPPWCIFFCGRVPTTTMVYFLLHYHPSVGAWLELPRCVFCFCVTSNIPVRLVTQYVTSHRTLVVRDQ